jgi:hypothetical protein
MKLRFLTGLAIGYVLGARAGRQRYDQILESLRDLTDSDLAHQLRDEVGRLTGAGGADRDGGTGMVTPPVVVGPGPAAATRAGGPADASVLDLEETPTAGGPVEPGAGTPAKRLDPPGAS